LELDVAKTNEKKICFLISNNFVNDNRTKRQAKALVEEGYKVTILCPDVSARLKKQETIDGILVKRVLEDWLPTVPKNKEQLGECKKYLQAALDEDPDLYISKDLDTLFYGWLCSKKKKKKLVYNADEYWQDLTLGGLGPKTKVYYKIYFFFAERIFIHRASLVTTVNDAIAKKMKSVFFLKKLPTVIMNSPELVVLKRNERLREDTGFKNEKIIIYVGIFSEGRGLDKLIQASKLLQDDFGVVLLGYGPQENLLKEMIKNEGLESKVKLLKAVPFEGSYRQ
jgi:glycosyltransferase involved in cell wall biosynthesis